MLQTIEVTVSPKGETHLETKGFQGKACQEATRELEAALGLSSAEELKPEFYAESTMDVTQPQRL